MDPVVISTFPFMFVWMFLKTKGDRRKVAKMIMASVIVFLICISPWVIRNKMVFGRFVFIKSNLGNELFKGNNEYATGHFNVRMRDTGMKSELEIGQSNEVTQNRLRLQAGLTFIAEHPWRFARLTLTRVVHYWTFMLQTAKGVQEWFPLSAYFVVLILACISLMLPGGRRRDIQLVWLFLLSFPLIYYVTVIGLFRYRFPLESLLMVLAGHTVYWVTTRGKLVLLRTPSRLVYSRQ